MNREQLKELGLSEEQIETVMKFHGQTVNETKNKLNETQSEIELYKSQLEARDNDMETLKEKAAKGEGLEDEINNLKETYEEAKRQHEESLQKTKREYELDIALTQNNVRDPVVIKPLIDNESIVLTDEGKIEGLNEQLETLKETHSYLFKGVQTQEDDNHIPGSTIKLNRQKEVDAREQGRLKALERHAKNKEE